MIELINVEKYFKKPIRGKGVWGMFKTLFSRKHTLVKAVDGVSFTVGEARLSDISERTARASPPLSR